MTPAPEPALAATVPDATGPALPAPGHAAPGGERELLPVATGARSRAVVVELLRPRRRPALVGFGVLVAATAAGMLTAPLLGRVVDAATRGSTGEITACAVALALVAVVQGAATGLGLTRIAGLGETVLADLRERFVERALHLPLEQVERAGSGDLTSRVTGDVAVVARAVRNALPELARSLLTVALTLVGLAVLDWRFLLAALLAVPVQLHTARWYARRAVPLYARQRVATGAQQQQLLDTVGGAATVRALRLADQHTERVARRSAAAVELALAGIRLVLRFYSRLHVAEYLGLVAVVASGFWLVRQDAVSIGTATAAALYVHGLFGPVNTALGLVDDAQAATAGLARLVGVADLAPPGRSPRSAAPADASVVVRGLGHAYRPGHPVLRDVTLSLAPGERVALVGASGAGKSTLARLVAGVHRPERGSVLLGGASPADLGPEVLRGTVALITQEVHVFAGRLAEDLRLARPDATDAELTEALRRVGALPWALALPEGLATVVGAGGHRLTVAQAQQLALARLLLADPPIVVLDEATAEAGSAGARTLEDAASVALEGRTALVVAHRLTQARTADRIVVLDRGRVVETGTHLELVAARGHYAALWEAWSAQR
ncbi:multidrug ABC transporter permease [Wenjunlia vitaminophila]|uniref:Multidrug ABC transporter permease n=1 Tax=Wenjunlia vitaminophila TaxID=76728 RepID=A0A0T6LWN0_WENVI|nr:ABC transporter ATP-binding protein [Wenjunlia vitaminophila]KRV50461.1 multidrug ABC transporter permease [Wenjunlia vitaminophila]